MLTHWHPKSAQKKGKNDKGRNTEWKENRKKTERKRKERKNDKADKVVKERIRVATNYIWDEKLLKTRLEAKKRLKIFKEKATFDWKSCIVEIYFWKLLGTIFWLQ